MVESGRRPSFWSCMAFLLCIFCLSLVGAPLAIASINRLQLFVSVVSCGAPLAARQPTCLLNYNIMSFVDTITTYLLYVLAFPTAFWLVMYLLPQVYMSTIRPVPNLKKRYNAKWALVTGSGSGIGKAIAFKLASQGLNVVLVSLDDDHLKNTMKQLKAKYPDLEFRSVGCVFNPGVKYIEEIEKATKDITIQCIFNNAGFIVTGFVDQTPLPKILSNIECNATASFAIAHHFLQKLVTNKQKGCIVFTSSVAGFIPTPFAASYAATKAFVSQLACSLHIEVQSLGIDVCAVHPSPVASNFYEKVRVIIALE